MEDSNSKLKRIKRFFLNKNYKVKEYLKWYKIYDNKRHFLVKQKIMNLLMIIFILSIGILSIFIFFYAINDYKIENIIELNKKFNIESKDILLAQISNTLIIISVISLLSGLSESERIFGGSPAPCGKAA